MATGVTHGPPKEEGGREWDSVVVGRMNAVKKQPGWIRTTAKAKARD